MKIKKVLLFTLFIFLLSLFLPQPSKAASLSQIINSENSLILKVQESLEYFFNFKVENKIQVLEKHAEKRLVMAKGYAEEGNNERVENVIQNYLEIKEKQDELLKKANDKDVMDIVEERTIEQQKTMEEIKNGIDNDTKQNVIAVQEQVVNQVAKHVVEVNGPEGATNFINEVVHVWAPGTGPGDGNAGVVYEGGGKLIYAPGTKAGGTNGLVIEGGELKFAPGTSAGGGTQDINTVEIKTGGTVNEEVKDSGGAINPPNTIQNNSVNTIDPGTVDPGSNETWTIDP